MQEPHREVHALDRDLKLGSRDVLEAETAIRAAVNLQLHAADRGHFALLILHDFLRRHLEELFAAFLMRRGNTHLAGPVGPGFRLVFVLRGF